MKVNHVDNTSFGMHFTPNKELEKLYKRSSINKKTLRLAHRLARKHKGQEVRIEDFVHDYKSGKEVINSFKLHNLSNSVITEFSFKGYSFDINGFLKKLIKWNGFFYLSKADKIQHYLTGTKKTLNNLID